MIVLRCSGGRNLLPVRGRGGELCVREAGHRSVQRAAGVGAHARNAVFILNMRESE